MKGMGGNVRLRYLCLLICVRTHHRICSSAMSFCTSVVVVVVDDDQVVPMVCIIGVCVTSERSHQRPERTETYRWPTRARGKPCQLLAAGADECDQVVLYRIELRS